MTSVMPTLHLVRHFNDEHYISIMRSLHRQTMSVTLPFHTIHHRLATTNTFAAVGSQPEVASYFSCDERRSSSTDLCLESSVDWPAIPAYWNELFQVSVSLATPDIPLWTQLAAPQRSHQEFLDHEDRCLNCHGNDHSFKQCQQPLTDVNDCLNPQLGQLGGTGETYRHWQRRILSHSCPNSAAGYNTRLSPFSERRRHAFCRNNSRFTRPRICLGN